MFNLRLCCLTVVLATFVAVAPASGQVGGAMAQDLPVRPASSAPAPVAAYNWTGLYVGGQVGFNWQTGPWVVGVEVEASFGEVRKGVTWIDPDINPFTDASGLVVTKRIGSTVESLGSVAVRAGRAWDRSLVYVKGGAAWARDFYRAFNLDLPSEPLLASARDTRWGWMAGIGYEHALWDKWSARIEYDYLGLGDKRSPPSGSGRRAGDAGVRYPAEHLAGQAGHQLPFLRHLTPGPVWFAAVWSGETPMTRFILPGPAPHRRAAPPSRDQS